MYTYTYGDLPLAAVNNHEGRVIIEPSECVEMMSVGVACKLLRIHTGIIQDNHC